VPYLASGARDRGDLCSRPHGSQGIRQSAGMQIWGDVFRREPLDWFAIDDDEFGWPAWCRDKLVQTEGYCGLSDAAVQERIRQRLAKWDE